MPPSTHPLGLAARRYVAYPLAFTSHAPAVPLYATDTVSPPHEVAGDRVTRYTHAPPDGGSWASVWVFTKAAAQPVQNESLTPLPMVTWTVAGGAAQSVHASPGAV